MSADTALFHWSLPEVRIVVTYFILASLWIVGSDTILSQATTSNAVAVTLQSLKGLNFVITTAILLFLVLRRAYGGWRLAEHQRWVVMEEGTERYRRLSSHIQTLREDDRTRIAREIHDELGQFLTGIKMAVRLVENELSDRDDRTLNHAIDQLVEVGEMVDSTIASVQRISSGLRPSALDNLGLCAALQEEAALFSQRSGIPCAMDLGEIPEALPPDVSIAIFRIFQEALTNVARHAGAKRVEASLSVRDNDLKLAITDDGKGIDPAALTDPQSLGLIGMRERAENVGGQVIFCPSPDTGTDVVLTVPLPQGALPSSKPDPTLPP